MNDTHNYRLAAQVLNNADALLIGAGAGMGVDSGLPDFRGPEGFWKAYPPFRGRRFSEMSTPHWFESDPQLAWGFFGHRSNLYRSAIPHEGFEILLKWANRLAHGCFVFTSNVDGQFQKAGFDEARVVECHGSIHHLQCAIPCQNKIWPASQLNIDVDMTTIRTNSTLPKCPHCDGIARPNILMFSDSNWVSDRSDNQMRNMRRWEATSESIRMVTIEIGAGLAIPTVRFECEARPGTLIRINPREAEVPEGGISLPATALTALKEIDALIG